MGKWTVKPTVRSVPVSVTLEGVVEHFEITLKRTLNVGEERGFMTAGWQGMTGKQGDEAATIGIDWKLQTFARTHAYLVDWTLTENDEKLDARSLDVIRSLNPDVYKAIEDAITKHVEEMDAAKKQMTAAGTSAPSTTSAS